VWDDTLPIKARVGEYLLIARRSGDTWFIGAMTNEDAREFELPLDFLGEGSFRATIMRDGANAHNHAEDYRQEIKTVSSADTLSLKLAINGGWAAIIEPSE
jgi:alpha-glucosidase